MTSNADLAQRAQKVLFPNYRTQPIALVRGEGSHVWDADGKRYLDFFAGLSVANLGHCHPAVVEAVQSQVGTLMHVAERGLPEHPLISRGYASIGCAPTTRPVAEGEDPRAGRWSESSRFSTARKRRWQNSLG